MNDIRRNREQALISAGVIAAAVMGFVADGSMQPLYFFIALALMLYRLRNVHSRGDLALKFKELDARLNEVRESLEASQVELKSELKGELSELSSQLEMLGQEQLKLSQLVNSVSQGQPLRWGLAVAIGFVLLCSDTALFFKMQRNYGEERERVAGLLAQLESGATASSVTPAASLVIPSVQDSHRLEQQELAEPLVMSDESIRASYSVNRWRSISPIDAMSQSKSEIVKANGEELSLQDKISNSN